MATPPDGADLYGVFMRRSSRIKTKLFEEAATDPKPAIAKDKKAKPKPLSPVETSTPTNNAFQVMMKQVYIDTFRTSYLHPQLVAMICHYDNIGAVPARYWKEDHRDFTLLLAEPSTPLHVAAQCLKEIAEDIALDEKGRGTAAVPYPAAKLEAMILRWYEGARDTWRAICNTVKQGYTAAVAAHAKSVKEVTAAKEEMKKLEADSSAGPAAVAAAAAKAAALQAAADGAWRQREAQALKPILDLPPSLHGPWPQDPARMLRYHRSTFNVHQREYADYAPLQCPCLHCLQDRYALIATEQAHQRWRAQNAAYNASLDAAGLKNHRLPVAPAFGLMYPHVLADLHLEKQQLAQETSLLRGLSLSLSLFQAEWAHLQASDLAWMATTAATKPDSLLLPQPALQVMHSMAATHPHEHLSCPVALNGNVCDGDVATRAAWCDVSSWIGLPSPVATVFAPSVTAATAAMKLVVEAERDAGAEYWRLQSPSAADGPRPTVLPMGLQQATEVARSALRTTASGGAGATAAAAPAESAQVMGQLRKIQQNIVYQLGPRIIAATPGCGFVWPGHPAAAAASQTPQQVAEALQLQLHIPHALLPRQHPHALIMAAHQALALLQAAGALPRDYCGLLEESEAATTSGTSPSATLEKIVQESGGHDYMKVEFTCNDGSKIGFEAIPAYLLPRRYHTAEMQLCHYPCREDMTGWRALNTAVSAPTPQVHAPGPLSHVLYKVLNLSELQLRALYGVMMALPLPFDMRCLIRQPQAAAATQPAAPAATATNAGIDAEVAAPAASLTTLPEAVKLLLDADCVPNSPQALVLDGTHRVLPAGYELDRLPVVLRGVKQRSTTTVAWARHFSVYVWEQLAAYEERLIDAALQALAQQQQESDADATAATTSSSAPAAASSAPVTAVLRSDPRMLSPSCTGKQILPDGRSAPLGWRSNTVAATTVPDAMWPLHCAYEPHNGPAVWPLWVGLGAAGGEDASVGLADPWLRNPLAFEAVQRNLGKLDIHRHADTTKELLTLIAELGGSSASAEAPGKPPAGDSPGSKAPSRGRLAADAGVLREGTYGAKGKQEPKPRALAKDDGDEMDATATNALVLQRLLEVLKAPALGSLAADLPPAMRITATAEEATAAVISKKPLKKANGRASYSDAAAGPAQAAIRSGVMRPSTLQRLLCCMFGLTEREPAGTRMLHTTQLSSVLQLQEPELQHEATGLLNDLQLRLYVAGNHGGLHLHGLTPAHLASLLLRNAEEWESVEDAVATAVAAADAHAGADDEDEEGDSGKAGSRHRLPPSAHLPHDSSVQPLAAAGGVSPAVDHLHSVCRERSGSSSATSSDCESDGDEDGSDSDDGSSAAAAAAQPSRRSTRTRGQGQPVPQPDKQRSRSHSDSSSSDSDDDSDGDSQSDAGTSVSGSSRAGGSVAADDLAPEDLSAEEEEGEEESDEEDSDDPEEGEDYHSDGYVEDAEGDDHDADDEGEGNSEGEHDHSGSCSHGGTTEPSVSPSGSTTAAVSSSAAAAAGGKKQSRAAREAALLAESLVDAVKPADADSADGSALLSRPRRRATLGISYAPKVDYGVNSDEEQEEGGGGAGAGAAAGAHRGRARHASSSEEDDSDDVYQEDSQATEESSEEDDSDMYVRESDCSDIEPPEEEEEDDDEEKARARSARKRGGSRGGAGSRAKSANGSRPRARSSDPAAVRAPAAVPASAGDASAPAQSGGKRTPPGCKLCGLAYAGGWGDGAAHMTSAHAAEIAAQPLMCRHCGTVIGTAADLKKHETSHFAAFVCDHEGCGATFNTQRSLDRHKLKHSGVRFACTWPGCTKNFTDQGNMQTHRRKHEGMRYQCQHCPHQATEPNGLKKHIRAIHQGWRYPCPVEGCEILFTRPDALRQHLCGGGHGWSKADAKAVKVEPVQCVHLGK